MGAEHAHREGPEAAGRTVATGPDALGPAQPAQASLLALQGRVGNAAVAGLVRRLAVQRHAAGAPTSFDESAVGAELANPPPLQATAGGPAPAGAPPDGGGTAPGAGGGATAGTGGTTTPDGSGGAPGAAPAQATGGPAPAAASTTAMSVATAQQVLQSAFGSTHQIIQGQLVLLPDQAATWAKYDEVCSGRPNPNTNRPWVAGDAQKYIPGLQGFADSGTTYIMKVSSLPTVTVHEMLHINTADGFRGAVGETVNEGTTETLAREAVTAAGIAVDGAGVPQAYPNQRAAVDHLMGLVSEGVVKTAYFGGPDTLISAYETIQGTGTWASFKAAAESLNANDIANWTMLPTSGKLVAKINQLFDWVVTDTNMQQIIFIYQQAGAEQADVAAAIRKRIPDLNDFGRRAQLRLLIGS